MLLAEVFDKAGVPDGVFNVVNGYGPTVGAGVIRSSRCRYDVFYRIY
jgi:acyl-CoA reductase-like NAD-dependent aldehyde dehydrogenase